MLCWMNIKVVGSSPLTPFLLPPVKIKLPLLPDQDVPPTLAGEVEMILLSSHKWKGIVILLLRHFSYLPVIEDDAGLWT